MDIVAMDQEAAGVMSEFAGGDYLTVKAACDLRPGTVPFFMPMLVVLLEVDEEAKGAPLSEEEVLGRRDSAACIQMRVEDYLAMQSSRGPDLDPGDVWVDWLGFKQTGELTYAPARG
jgi:hypothetical protein